MKKIIVVYGPIASGKSKLIKKIEAEHKEAGFIAKKIEAISTKDFISASEFWAFAASNAPKKVGFIETTMLKKEFEKILKVLCSSNNIELSFIHVTGKLENYANKYADENIVG